jgi:putative membrane protein
MQSLNTMKTAGVEAGPPARKPRSMKDLFRAFWPPLPVWRRLDACVFLVMAYTGLVAAFQWQIEFSISNQAAVGILTLLNAIILGVLLGFRNRESYDRWWEARRLWGTLVNDSRNLCLKVRSMGAIPADDRARVAKHVAGFAIALRNHLRGGGSLQDVPGFETDPAGPAHVPAYIAGQVISTARNWRRGGHMTDFDLLWLDPHMKAFMDVAGACERIRNTPIPLSYRSLLRHGLVLYLVTTPWFVVDDIHFMAVPMMGILTYFLMGIELTAEDVEEPFGRDADDLALTAYCETIRKSVSEILSVPLSPVPTSVFIPGFRLPALPEKK